MLHNIRQGDSIVYYQCHVEEGVQQLLTASGQTVAGVSQKYTVTEKFVVTRRNSGWSVDYYTASLTVFPNRKFSALKIREKPYWGFIKQRSFVLNDQTARVLLALERKGREAMEYDFAVTKYTTNQLIIKHRKDFKQLVLEPAYVFSRVLAK